VERVLGELDGEEMISDCGLLIADLDTPNLAVGNPQFH
jgi:hypothetical protein